MRVNLYWLDLGNLFWSSTTTTIGYEPVKVGPGLKDRVCWPKTRAKTEAGPLIMKIRQVSCSRSLKGGRS